MAYAPICSEAFLKARVLDFRICRCKAGCSLRVKRQLHITVQRSCIIVTCTRIRMQYRTERFDRKPNFRGGFVHVQQLAYNWRTKNILLGVFFDRARIHQEGRGMVVYWSNW